MEDNNSDLNNGIKAEVFFSEEAKHDLHALRNLDKTAMDLKINNNSDYELVAARRAEIKLKYNKLAAELKSLKEPLREAEKRIDAIYKPIIEALKRAENYTGRIMIEHNNKLKAEHEKIIAEHEERARKERMRLAEQAAKAREQGKVEKAHAIETKADMVVAPAVLIEQPKTTGVSVRGTWKAKVVDFKAFYASIGIGSVAEEMAEPVYKNLNSIARIKRQKDIGIPGVEGYLDQSISQKV